MNDRRAVGGSEQTEVSPEALLALSAELARVVGESSRTAHDLGERVKELSCLYTVESLLHQSERQFPEVMQSLLASLAAGYQYPKIACARAFVEGRTYQTDNFQETPWRQVAPLVLGQEDIGTLEVGYLAACPASDEGPFLREERFLINAVAGHLMKFLLRRRVEHDLQASERKFRELVEHIYEGIWVIDADANTTLVNARMAELLGYQEDEMLGKHIFTFMDSHATNEAARILERVRTGVRADYEFEFLRKNGDRICTHFTTTPIYDEHGNYRGALAGIIDITETKQAERNLQRREQEFAALAERSPDIVARVDRALRISYVNPAVEHTSGRPRAWYLGKDLSTLGLVPRKGKLRRQVLSEIYDSAREHVIEHTSDWQGGVRHFQARLVPEFSADGVVDSVLIVDRDITALKEAQSALERLTLHDPMTGIPNRRYLNQFIEHEWRREVRHEHTIAVIMADIDHFKKFNDCYGHQLGDDCLRKVAQALQANLRRATDFLVRYGGEEFAIVMLETDLAEASQTAESLRRAVSARAIPNKASPVAPIVTVSFGVAAAPAHTTTFDKLLSAADVALYAAKQKGRNQVETVQSL